MSRFDNYCEEYYEAINNAVKGAETSLPNVFPSVSFNFLKETLASNWSDVAFQERLKKQVADDITQIQSTIIGFGVPKEKGFRPPEDIMAATRRLCLGQS